MADAAIPASISALLAVVKFFFLLGYWILARWVLPYSLQSNASEPALNQVSGRAINFTYLVMRKYTPSSAKGTQKVMTQMSTDALSDRNLIQTNQPSPSRNRRRPKG